MEDKQGVTIGVDRGEGREVHLEVSENSIWVVAGAGMENADLWMKQVAGIADLRIRIARTATGIEVSVDRGEQIPAWWKPGEQPTLAISLKPELGIATVTARAGGELHDLGSVAR